MAHNTTHDTHDTGKQNEEHHQEEEMAMDERVAW
jgi:hypothetical protein